MKTGVAVLAALAVWLAQPAQAQPGGFPVQEGWLSVSPAEFNLERAEPGGVDLGYLAPDAFTRLAAYDAVMVDQPEIWLAAESAYKGAKPDQLKALADFMRDRLTGRLIRRGYDVVEAPAPDVLYLRLALTDIYLGKPSGRAADYTPVEPGSDALGRSALAAVDMLAVAIQAELTDSRTGAVLVALILQRGSPAATAGIDGAGFATIIDEYASRLACRLDNSRLAEAEWIDCSDPAARTGSGAR